MAYAASELDFSIVDRARSLGDLLRLVFALIEGIGPKDVADILTEFDGLIVIDPETAGRWLRNERRPSKEHLKLIVRVLQSRGLIGKPPAKDRLFMRIAAFYAKLPEPQISAAAPWLGRTSSIEMPPVPAGLRFRLLRRAYERAMALHGDLDTPGDDLPRLSSVTIRPRAPVRAIGAMGTSPSQFLAQRPQPIIQPTSWRRLIDKLRRIILKISRT